MNIKGIHNQLRQFKSEKKKLFATTSLQSHSIVLLHILADFDKSIPVFFINTGYHFPETMMFKSMVAEKLGISIHTLESPVSKHLQKDRGSLLFTTDPDYCCYLNKVLPVENLLSTMDIWINGVRAEQSETRKNLQVFEKAAHDTTRFHPMLDWSNRMITDYHKKNKLPVHPLEEKGYASIGCEPCTRVTNGENSRDARWFGLNKTECGLNTDLIDKP